MNKNIILSILLIFMVTITVTGQQHPSISQYSLNKYLVNPAAAGYEGYTYVNLLGRSQYTGITGAPTSFFLSVDSRVTTDDYFFGRKALKNSNNRGNAAWGATIYNDNIGQLRRSGFTGTYSYHIPMGEHQLSMGLSFIIAQLAIDGDKIVVDDNGGYDPLLTGGDQTVWIPDASFGLFLAGRDYYVGYSTVQLLNSSVTFGNTSNDHVPDESADADSKGNYKLYRQHNLMAGYRFDVSRSIDIEPALLAKLYETGSTVLDFSTKFYIDEYFWTGLNYRTDYSTVHAAGLFLGYKFGGNYYLGYGFEYDFNSVGKYSFATHELTFLIRFGDSRDKKWIAN